MRVAAVADIKEFMANNYMPAALSLEEFKAAFQRHGLEYIGGENLDSHMIKSCIAKREKVVKERLPGLRVEFCHIREKYVNEKKVSFQIMMAKKL